MPPSEAVGVFRQVFNAVKKNQERAGGKKLVITRTKNAVTIYRACGVSLTAPPVQVILRVYDSLAAVLLHFDVDSCCFGFKPGGSQVLTTQRGLRALRYGVNIADTSRYSPSYCRRLEKYSGRGFGIGLPGYVPERVNNRIRDGSYVYILKYDMLFRVHQRQHHGKKMCVRGTTIERVESTQRAVVVRDVERLIVQHDNNTFLRHVDVPVVTICHQHECVDAEDARKTEAVLAVSTGLKDEYTLLWGAGDLDDDSEGSQDDEDVAYETTPIAAIYALLEKYLQIDDSQGEDAWFAGGLMERLTKHMNRNDHVGAAHAVSEHTYFQKRVGKRLLFVYDVVGCDADFKNLRFVIDAVRPPETTAKFEKLYGMPRLLNFERASGRPCASVDFWRGIY